MTRKIKDAGDTWKVYVGEDSPHAGVLPLIFHCTSNQSHGWRVVEVPEAEFGSRERLEDMSEAELGELFREAQPFDYSHDPKAREWGVGDTPLR